MKFICLIFFMMFTFLSCKSPKDLPTVSAVDLNQYIGKWYEIARLPNRFEKGLQHVSATYSFRDDGKIKVLNAGRDSIGNWKQSIGKAWVPNSDQPGRLKVQFFWPFAGDYYIIALDEQYQYALVGDPSRKYLWILSKTKQLDSAIYNGLMDIAQSNGFNVNNMMLVDQEGEEII